MRLLFALCALFCLFSCKEIEPTIGPLGPVELGDKKVLVEEFTGVQCVNCPQGSSELEGLRALYGDNLVVISIHAGDFAMPYPQSQYDFQTSDGNDLLNFLSAPEGYPAAIINRSAFQPDPLILVGTSKWANYIANELEAEQQLALELTTSFDAVTRQLTINATALPQVDLSAEAHRITIMITENNIKDIQLTPAGQQADYSHKHVLRAIVTPVNGTVLAEPFNIGQAINFSQTFPVPANWNAAQCDVVAFITLDNAANRKVLQVNSVPLTN